MVPAEETRWYWQGHDVHVARARRPDSAARVLLLHGAGGHSATVWPLAVLLADRGLDVAAVDLPLYGRTISPAPGSVTYDDWVALLLDLVEAEDDGRPLVVLGTSMGGLLGYEIGARSSAVAAVAATCLLDLHRQEGLSRFRAMGVLGRALAPLVRGRVATTMRPVRRFAETSKLSRDARLSALSAADPRGAGASVPLGFLSSYVRYRHVAPATMTKPVTLVHPAMDAWTPPRVSLPVVQETAGPTHVVMLRGCGHIPIEEPGLSDLVAAVVELADTACRTAR